jgi:hypothetical protein
MHGEARIEHSYEALRSLYLSVAALFLVSCFAPDWFNLRRLRYLK